MWLWPCLVLIVRATACAAGSDIYLSKERIVFQTSHGDIEMALYPLAAPKTTKHIMQLARLGAYNTNHFFRVDKGFVAQVADCAGGREAPLDARQAEEEAIRVPLEVSAALKHTHRGMLSMARHDDPNSGGSSFSIILNPTPHLDMTYTVFGEVINGLETLGSMEKVSTRTEGIFVMPEERISILSTYVHTSGADSTVPEQDSATRSQSGASAAKGCSQQLEELQQRFDAQAAQLQDMRSRRLPG